MVPESRNAISALSVRGSDKEDTSEKCPNIVAELNAA
jgi:hypothetical protein